MSGSAFVRMDRTLGEPRLDLEVSDTDGKTWRVIRWRFRHGCAWSDGPSLAEAYIGNGVPVSCFLSRVWLLTKGVELATLKGAQRKLRRRTQGWRQVRKAVLAAWLACGWEGAAAVLEGCCGEEAERRARRFA